MLVGAVIVEDRMDDLAGRHLRSTIRARQTCFCGLLRLATTASRRARSAAVALTMIPLRMPQTRTRREPRETLSDSSVRFYPLAIVLANRACTHKSTTLIEVRLAPTSGAKDGVIGPACLRIAEN